MGDHIVSFANNRPGPKSMAVFLEWNDGSGFYSLAKAVPLEGVTSSVKGAALEPTLVGMPSLEKHAREASKDVATADTQEAASISTAAGTVAAAEVEMEG